MNRTQNIWFVSRRAASTEMRNMNLELLDNDFYCLSNLHRGWIPIILQCQLLLSRSSFLRSSTQLIMVQDSIISKCCWLDALERILILKYYCAQDCTELDLDTRGEPEVARRAVREGFSTRKVLCYCTESKTTHYVASFIFLSVVLSFSVTQMPMCGIREPWLFSK